MNRVFSARLAGAPIQETVAWFDAGGAVKMTDTTPAGEALRFLEKVPGLIETTALLGVPEKVDPGLAVSACEFILEGLHVQQKIDRTEQRGYIGTPKVERKPREEAQGPPPGRRRSYN
jgi:magnesium chelatase subunit I